MSVYYRPFVRFDHPRPEEAADIAGGPGWFVLAARHERGGAVTLVDLDAIPDEVVTRLSAPRGRIAGLAMDRPRLMGILNVTPDSFSDGGQALNATQAVARGKQLARDGADIIDVGGESTRPGAQPVPAEAEIARIEPVIEALRNQSPTPISIDTRKVRVAEAAVRAGARIVNDVSGFTHDRMLIPFCAREGLPVCVMHAQGDPETMQDDPRYEDVLLDVYDFLAARVIQLEEQGIARDRIVVDPGIGFGKTLAHNLRLLNGLSIFHGIGCPILLGASRKGFIGQLSGAQPASARAPGSIAVALAAVAQGVQILRVHDVAETRQALTLWSAVRQGDRHVA